MRTNWERAQARKKRRINDFFISVGILISSGLGIFGLLHLFNAFFTFRG